MSEVSEMQELQTIQVIKCPLCGSTNTAKTTKGKVKEGATNFIAGMGIGIVKGLANTLIFDGAGRLIPSSIAGKAVQFVPLDHECLTCDCLFTVNSTSEGVVKDISLKKYPMPEQIIINVKNSYIEKCKRDRPYIAATILSIFTLIFIIYFIAGCFCDEFLRASLMIAFGFISSIISGIPAIIKICKIVSLNNEINMSENQSLIDFKHRHRNLFSEYNQFN